MAELADTYETLLVRRERARLHVTLNRPEVKNALNPTLIGELKQVFGILRERRDIKVVILRGAGGTFCAGADLKNMEQSFSDKHGPGEKDPIALNNREYGAFLEMVNTTPQVVVAAVEGYAIAGGFGLLCVSDVAICTEDAGFAMSETAIGIVPAQIAPFVAARIGVPQTRHLALTAARFKGPEALRLGIETDFARTLIRDKRLPAPSSYDPHWAWPIRIHALGGLRIVVDEQPLVFGARAQRKLLREPAGPGLEL